VSEISYYSLAMYARDAIVEAVRAMVPVARRTLEEYGSHLPTAVLHTLEGMVPIVLPFKNDHQKKALIQYVKAEAIRRHAFAVTTVTHARVVDSRTGEEGEALVLATAIQRGAPYVVVQPFTRDRDRSIEAFGTVIDGDEAAMPGQMMIIPDWDEEVCH
jgi:hypothetical protein